MANTSGTLFGKKGRSGRKPAHREQAYFTKLDAVLPEVIDFLIATVRKGAKSEIQYERDMAIKAANILNSKAPDRIKHSGDEDSPIYLSVDC